MRAIGRRRGESTCVYTLVGVLVDDADLDEVRAALCSLRSRKDKTIHWRRDFMWWLGGTCDEWSNLADLCLVIELNEP